MEGLEKEKYTVPLPPVVCDPIYDKKAMSELVITKLSHCSAPVSGGTEIILLCDRVTKDDIQIRFFEEQNGQLVWDAFADFQPNDVHKQVAISFRTPKYYTDNIPVSVAVQIQLRRPSDGHCSDARPFQLIPREVDPSGLSRKRQKIADVDFDCFVMAPPPQVHQHQNLMNMSSAPPEYVRVPRFAPKIKHEMPEAAAASSEACAWPSSDHSSDMFDVSLGMMDQAAAAVKSEEADGGMYVQENKNLVDGQLTEKLDSMGLDLDIDPNDLMNDINFNNMVVNLDSGSNVTFNSTGNIAAESASYNAHYATLNTPQGLEDNRNPLAHFSPNSNQSHES